MDDITSLVSKDIQAKRQDNLIEIFTTSENPTSVLLKAPKTTILDNRSWKVHCNTLDFQVKRHAVKTFVCEFIRGPVEHANWLDPLIEVVNKVEWRLYDSANSAAEYSDPTTLSRRIEVIFFIYLNFLLR